MMTDTVTEMAESVIKLPGIVTREEFEAALLQVHSEIAEDRKRITMIEEFTIELYHILYVKFRNIRQLLEDTLLSKVPYHFTRDSNESPMDESTAEM